jgi:hypothetical protein
LIDVKDQAETVRLVEAKGAKAQGWTCDVTDENQVNDTLAAIGGRFDHVDVLVNNAGILSDRKPWYEHTKADVERFIQVNYVGYFLVTKAAYPLLKRSQVPARIINVASRTFFSAPPGQMAYIASKGAVIGMTRVLAPISMSIWEEPGQLVRGHDHPPTVMMGHQAKRYQAYIEALGYTPAKLLLTYDLDVTHPFPPLIQRIVASGEKNPRIRIRNVDKRRFDEEAALILEILNDAWSDNWGFVPFTDREIAYAGKKFRPIVFEDLIMIAEYDGEPVAFMMTLPDLNEVLKPMRGQLFPFNWIRLLRWLRKPKARTMRVPLMGVRKKLQASRLASQLAFMMIEYIRRNAVARYGTTRGEIVVVKEDKALLEECAAAIESSG